MSQQSRSQQSNWWDSITKASNFGNKADQKKVIIAISSIGITIATALLINKYRARYHDNIPMIAKEEFETIRGHLPALYRTRDTRLKFQGWLYEAIKKAGFPSICCIARPPNSKLLFITNPIHVKYVFETHFGSAVKDAALRERYHELLGEGIFASNGERWKFHRKIASRMFSTRNLKNYMFSTSLKNTQSTITKLHDYDNKTVNMNDLLGRFTLDTFVEIAFGQCLNAVTSYPKEHAFGVAFDNMVQCIGRRATDILWKTKRALNIGSEFYIHSDHMIIKQFVQDIVNNKNKHSGHMADETGKESYDILDLYLKHDATLTFKDLYDISLNFIIAGRDTTRMLLSWWIWELSQKENKEILTKLYQEIDNFTRIPTYSDFIHAFKYLEKSLCETLRLQPPVPFLKRECVKDIVLPKIEDEDRGYIIRKGDGIIVNNYTMGRNGKVWGDDACQFKPERWTKGLNTFDQYKFAVFNVNPRICLGKNFAIQEAKIFGFYFLKNFTFEMVEGHQVIIKGGAILNMENGLPIILKARTSHKS